MTHACENITFPQLPLQAVTRHFSAPEQIRNVQNSFTTNTKPEYAPLRKAFFARSALNFYNLYREETNVRRLCFYRLVSVHGGCLLRGVSALGGVCSWGVSAPGRVSAPRGLLQGVRYAPSPGETATAVDGTHPTGMHSCISTVH